MERWKKVTRAVSPSSHFFPTFADERDATVARLGGLIYIYEGKDERKFTYPFHSRIIGRIALWMRIIEGTAEHTKPLS